MTHRVVRSVIALLVFSFWFFLPVPASASDQTPLSRLVKTKYLKIARAAERHDQIRPVQLAQIQAYGKILSDIQKQAHQLKFLVAVSESNPFEVRTYFRQAALLSAQFDRETLKIKSLAMEIDINLSIVKSAEEDLRFLLTWKIDANQKTETRLLLDSLERLKTTEMTIKKQLDKVMNRSATVENLLQKYDKGLEEEMAAVWTIYFTRPLFVLFDKGIPGNISRHFVIWVSGLRSTLESKLPDRASEWGKSGLAFLIVGFVSLIIYRLFLVRIIFRSHSGQKGWSRFLSASSLFIFLFAGLLAVSMVNRFPENIVFSKLSITFGAAAAMLLAWRLREIRLESGLSSPLVPLYCLYLFGIVVQLVNMPLLLLGLVWPPAVGIMMAFMWRGSLKHHTPKTRRLALFCFWSGIPIIVLSLSGFTFPSIVLFLTLFLCCILYQFSLAISDLIRGRISRLEDRGGALLRSVGVSLGIPLFWFLSAAFIVVWLAGQFGQVRILDLADKMAFHWKDVHIGFIQIALAAALFFVVQTVAQVLKHAVDSMGRKSRVDQAAIVPLKTVVGYGVWGLYGLLLLNIIGVSLSSIVVLAGGMSVGIGFGLQHIILSTTLSVDSFCCLVGRFSRVM